MVRYKQRCMRCKNNMVIVTQNTKFPLCYDCQKDELHKDIKDPKMKKMFEIPEDFYKNNAFLRSIKINYIRFGKLSDKQIEWFNKTVDGLKKDK